MIKTINIDGKDVTFKTSFTSFLIFKNQFKYDAIQRLLPMLGEALESFDSDIDIKNFKIQNLGEIFKNIYAFELVDILNLLWAFAKNYDNDIKDPEIFFNEFESFPLFDILKELCPVIFSSLISKKKLAISKTAQQ